MENHFTLFSDPCLSNIWDKAAAVSQATAAFTWGATDPLRSSYLTRPAVGAGPHILHLCLPLLWVLPTQSAFAKGPETPGPLLRPQGPLCLCWDSSNPGTLRPRTQSLDSVEKKCTMETSVYNAVIRQGKTKLGTLRLKVSFPGCSS